MSAPADPTDDSSRLLGLLDVFEHALTDFTTLVRELDDAEWELPTDLAGWSVHDLVSHTAHLEAILSGADEETLEVPAGLTHVRGPMGTYTEQGVIARRAHTRAELLAELEDATSRRLAQTRQSPPTDASASPPTSFGGTGWSWGQMLSNRPLDVWMHEQDIRRATGRPGDLDSPSARHVIEVFSGSWGLVVAKRAGARPGQTVALELTDQLERTVVTIDEAGRGLLTTVDTEPDVTVRMDAATYVVLCGGRRAPDQVQVEVQGDDPELARRIMASMTLTP